jgi:PEP-CTERM motif
VGLIIARTDSWDRELRRARKALTRIDRARNYSPLTLDTAVACASQSHLPNDHLHDARWFRGEPFGQALFLNTFGLVTDGPVFGLPDGYTANAGDYLVNNRFGGSTSVAEPSTLALLGLGLAGLGWTCRRT